MELTNSAYRFSPHQRSVWLWRGQEASNVVAVGLLEGPVDPDRLRQAMTQVVTRHEALRTVYRSIPGTSTPFRVVLAACEPVWETANLTEVEASEREILDDFVRQERKRRFDLASGPPLHVWLCELAPQRWMLTLTAPVLSSEGPSLRVVLEDLHSSYVSAGPATVTFKCLRMVHQPFPEGCLTSS
jgi:hypothetical protein